MKTLLRSTCLTIFLIIAGHTAIPVAGQDLNGLQIIGVLSANVHEKGDRRD